MDDFELCHKYLYHSSTDMFKDVLVYGRIFEMGDGFGNLSGAELSEMELWYDWSHIRDSSDKALAKMAEAIRKYVYKRANPGPL